jgi:Flp pilus assembly protein TadD
MLHYLHGRALDRAGRWDEALPALERAVKLAPEQPEALKYLGYAQVERGENLPGAQALLERARTLKPDDSDIADSLGWAYYASGRGRRALPLLEQAARAIPAMRAPTSISAMPIGASAAMEARYAWRAATLTADAGDIARLKPSSRTD